MGRSKELALNSVYFMIGNLGAKVVGFVMVPLYTIWFVPSDYGTVDLINTYNQILALIVGLNVAEALVVFPINKSELEWKSQFSTAVLFHLLTCVYFFLFFLLLDVCRFEVLTSINNFLWYAFGTLTISSISRLFQYFCRGIKRMKVFSFTGIMSAITTALFSFILIPRYGVKGYLIAMMASSVATIIFLVFYAKVYQYFDISKYSRALLKDMVKYAMPLIPNSLLWWLILGLNRPLLEQHWGVATLGILAVANKIPSLIDMFYGFFHQSWIVTVVSEYGKKDFDEYYNKVFHSMIVFQSFVCIVIMGAGRFILDVLIDDKYSEAWLYIPFMCLTVVVSNISTFSTTIFNAIKKTKYMFYTVIFATIISVILNYTLIPAYGLWGALIAMFAAHAVSAISRISFGWRFVRIRKMPSIMINIGVCCLALLCARFSNKLEMYVAFVTILCLYAILNRSYMQMIVNKILKRSNHYDCGFK